VRHEFDLIFEESHSLAMVVDLEVFGALRAIHPDLQFANYKPTLDYQLSDELSDFVIPDILSFHQTLAWVIWLTSLPVASIETIAQRLAFPSVLTTAAVAASKIHLTPYPPGSQVSQKTFYLDAFPPLAIYAAWIMANDQNIQQILSDYLFDWRNVKPYTTGYTLQQRGLEPGPIFKEILTRLRAAWLDGEVQTEDEENRLLADFSSIFSRVHYLCSYGGDSFPAARYFRYAPDRLVIPIASWHQYSFLGSGTWHLNGFISVSWI
jgi:tRNA nucleotidyltransferase (CCA-adding enzyme)